MLCEMLCRPRGAYLKKARLTALDPETVVARDADNIAPIMTATSHIIVMPAVTAGQGLETAKKLTAESLT